MCASESNLVRLVRLLMRAYFRRIEVTGVEHIPKDGGGVLVSWHPNGLIDPALIISCFPKSVVFGARHGLFRWPGLGWLMRTIGTVPIYRAGESHCDETERRRANAQSLQVLASAVSAGRWTCLFPEGDSHDSPHLLDLKTGAARFFFTARGMARSNESAPSIVPVGLHYDSKRSFRSHALVSFHPPLELPPRAPASAESPSDAQVHILTSTIERALREVVHATESWEVHFLMHRVRKLVRAERALRAGSALRRPKMAERQLAFSRVWSGYGHGLIHQPSEVARLRAAVTAYDADLRALGLEDHHLDAAPPRATPLRALGLVVQLVAVFVLLPPLLAFGILVNALPAATAVVGARVFAPKRKDEATIKLALGTVLLPAAWLTAGVTGMLLHDQLHQLFPSMPRVPAVAGVTSAVLSVIGGVASLRYARLVRETLHALRVRVTRSRRSQTLSRLRHERASLFDAIEALANNFDLPGAVASDGRIVPDGSEG